MIAIFKTIDIFKKLAVVGQAKQMAKIGIPSPHTLDSLFHLLNGGYNWIANALLDLDKVLSLFS
jgi:hypothetical protein